MDQKNHSVSLWHTKENLSIALSTYLKEKGFQLYKEENLTGKKEIIVFAISKGRKEIIEIKGDSDKTSPTSRKQLLEAAYAVSNDMLSPLEELYTSLLSLANQYNNKVLPVCLCLPDLPQYREIIHKVSAHFIQKNLDLKIYMIEEKGTVKEVYMINKSSLEASVTVLR